MLLLASVLLAVHCVYLQQCGAFAGPARWRVRSFMEGEVAATKRGGAEVSEDEVVTTPVEQAAPMRSVRPRDGETARGGKRLPMSAPRHRRLHRQWTAPGRRHEDDRGDEDPFYRRLFNRRQARDTNGGPLTQHRFRPERHERCDDDLDCRVSPSQVCVKRAYEPFGRCQCPFYRPVEITVNAVVRCVTAKNLFDEDQCRPANNLQQWMSWLVPIVVVVALSVTSVACFLSRRRSPRVDELVRPAALQPAGDDSSRAEPSRPTACSTASPLRRPQLSWLRVPPNVHQRMREWVRFYEKGSPSNAAASGYPATPAASLGPTPIFWAKRAIRLLPSPLYQGKLLQNVVPRASAVVTTGAFFRKCAAGAGRLAGVVATHSKSRKASESGVALMPTNTKVLPTTALPPAPVVLEVSRRSERPQSPLRSEDASSFQSFPTAESAVPGAHAAAPTFDDIVQLRRLRRSLAGGSLNGADDVRSTGGASDDEPVQRTVRRVSFADY
ncbi:hypothetical protein MTO96_021708 [Rhipicephalus appendiculatus]